MAVDSRTPEQPADGAGTQGVTRRAVIRSVAAAGAAAAGLGLAACGDDSTSSGTSPGGNANPAPAPAPAPNNPPPPPAGGGQALAKTDEIPLRGGKVFNKEYVITQPTKGQFAAFSAKCTHQGCPVTDVSETINCRCHGSKFSIDDGSPQDGPAQTPLEQLSVTVQGDSIVRA